jgi:hypothetical protein
MLKVYDMDQCHPTRTPTSDGQRLTKGQQPQNEEQRREMRGIKDRHAVGNLLYVALVTRFDIANAVRELARFMEDPGPEHWGAAKRIMRYLKGTLDHDLVLGPFPRGELRLIGFSDSDWAGDTDTRRSTTGYVFVLGDNAGEIRSGAISANSRLQPTNALSSTEAEWMAACSAAVEVVYLRGLLGDIGHPQVGATRVYEDNQSAIHIANSAIGQWNPRTRHMDVRYKFVKEKVRSNEIELVYVSTLDQLADILTKNLGTTQFIRLAARILGHRAVRNQEAPRRN